MRVLFVCTHNRCRSVLGEVIGRRVGQDTGQDIGKSKLETASAGSQPAGSVHPETLRQLAARGYATDGLRSNGLDEAEAFSPQVVVTVCDNAAKEACPVWLGDDAITVHWGLPDPTRADSQDEMDRGFDDVIATLERRLHSLTAQPLDELDRPQLQQLFTELAGID
ncbi:MAG: arsenate reductase ArsC [Pseudomonadota bacterium]